MMTLAKQDREIHLSPCGGACKFHQADLIFVNMRVKRVRTPGELSTTSMDQCKRRRRLIIPPPMSSSQLVCVRACVRVCVRVQKAPSLNGNGRDIVPMVIGRWVGERTPRLSLKTKTL